MKPVFRIVLFVILIIWVLGNFSEILSGSSSVFSILHLITGKAYSMVCHQDQLKLLCTESACTQLCARCTGIYLGALLTAGVTVFVSTINTPKLYFLVASILLILLDILFYNTGIYTYNHWIALVTGLFLGSVAFLYIRSGFEKLLFELK